ncbi:5-formyltetrahydrofolate cyclo-ligase [Limnobacter humi]|uniref:5-formyltetrahydrofolate cyclo-ligase n=1 Tax=Limnobacter humi TaxID=1778671 RepID=A0ABT1WEI3_9BURK|nr:5-formyltetrahydrofolate cyclo-ligase [Limnobacter humi]MCQ8894834.1 5-formyltetrahydrofolate cyclo-ligase [Limnobacter humi]
MKKNLRQWALAQRANRDAAAVLALGQQIRASLLTVLQSLGPCTVGLYHPFKGEPDVLPIVQSKALEAYSWALPVCIRSPVEAKLQFAQWHADDPLEVGEYGIPVPVHKHWVKPAVLIIPCLAFHRSGARLGYGAGWYDKTLQTYEAHGHLPFCIGIAYSASEVADDFREPHDRLLDAVVTEQGTRIG